MKRRFFTNLLVNSWNKIIPHYSRPTVSPLTLYICSPIFSIQRHCLTVSYFSIFCPLNRRGYFMKNFHSTNIFSVNETNYRANFAVGGIINFRKYDNHSVGTRTNTRRPVRWWFTRHWVKKRRYFACAIFPLLLHLLPKIYWSSFQYLLVYVNICISALSL